MGESKNIKKGTLPTRKTLILNSKENISILNYILLIFNTLLHINFKSDPKTEFLGIVRIKKERRGDLHLEA